MVRRPITAVCLIVLCTATAARAQFLFSEPVALAGGRVTLGGDVSASYGTKDPGFYTYTDYQSSTLRRFRAGLSTQVTASDYFAVLGEFRVENTTTPYARALYGRVQPWPSHGFEVRIGRLPPTFGAFTSRAYSPDNSLIGYPLGYQYLISLRPDALPANADELLAMRGRGWLSSFSLGNPARDNGVPLVEAVRGDTGVQAKWSNQILSATGSVTTGTLANPLLADDNNGRQFAARFTAKPVVGLLLGTSVSRGAFIDSGAARAAGAGDQRQYPQTAWGADAEYSRGYYLLRFEAVVSQWTLPPYHPPLIDEPLRSAALSFEGKYKIAPGLYAAARIDHLGFSDLAGSAGVKTWEANVSRIEVGGGYSIQRNVTLKGSYQHNKRDTSFVPSANLVAAEVVFWF
jgi:hypothetical protein